MLLNIILYVITYAGHLGKFMFWEDHLAFMVISFYTEIQIGFCRNSHTRRINIQKSTKSSV